MGTHPIFESDFDCLTDSELRVIEMPDPTPAEKKKRNKGKKETKKRKKSKKSLVVSVNDLKPKSLESSVTLSEPVEVYNPETIRWLNSLENETEERDRIMIYKQNRRDRYKLAL